MNPLALWSDLLRIQAEGAVTMMMAWATLPMAIAWDARRRELTNKLARR